MKNTSEVVFTGKMYLHQQNPALRHRYARTQRRLTQTVAFQHPILQGVGFFFKKNNPSIELSFGLMT